MKDHKYSKVFTMDFKNYSIDPEKLEQIRNLVSKSSITQVKRKIKNAIGAGKSIEVEGVNIDSSWISWSLSKTNQNLNNQLESMLLRMNIKSTFENRAELFDYINLIPSPQFRKDGSIIIPSLHTLILFMRAINSHEATPEVSINSLVKQFIKNELHITESWYTANDRHVIEKFRKSLIKIKQELVNEIPPQ